ncbi:MAG: transcriptional regulator, partial [Oscillospiraceae bacterium]|nr:transcriptional regulator [Oscillospiraceae bacterium]
SMDYIYGRTDDPNGGNFICTTQFATEEANFDAFLEMCFDPRTEANKKLKAALKRLMKEGNY